MAGIDLDRAIERGLVMRNAERKDLINFNKYMVLFSLCNAIGAWNIYDYHITEYVLNHTIFIIILGLTILMLMGYINKYIFVILNGGLVGILTALLMFDSMSVDLDMLPKLCIFFLLICLFFVIATILSNASPTKGTVYFTSFLFTFFIMIITLPYMF